MASRLRRRVREDVEPAVLAVVGVLLLVNGLVEVPHRELFTLLLVRSDGGKE